MNADTDRPASLEPVKPSRFALRATLFLVAVAILYGVLAVLTRLQAPDSADLTIALLGVPIVYAGMLAVVWGMHNVFPWAEPAAIGIMWVLIIEGGVSTLAACAAGPGAVTISIPIGAIAAALVLWTSAGLRDRRSLTEGQQGCAAVLIALVALGMLWPYAVGALIAGAD